ncbi:uncharacterized protein LOC122378039 [Amphibalanus amphitrite]|uniref:uncharacterized protein LOC122378038 n=1 Tax=Amphibalanus amphitrite TaxID=1232801 RepID=UPI001C910E16|nr:uncharacterized protein LOC122378038 [Amphibalanus amphitrite]XP_043214680.1 uncharacterized protein LOC122378039 [Amphibalanus amphitrite]
MILRMMTTTAKGAERGSTGRWMMKLHLLGKKSSKKRRHRGSTRSRTRSKCSGRCRMSSCESQGTASSARRRTRSSENCGNRSKCSKTSTSPATDVVADVHGLARRLEDAVIWLEENKGRLAKDVSVVNVDDYDDADTGASASPRGEAGASHHLSTPARPLAMPSTSRTEAETPTRRPTHHDVNMVTIGPFTAITSAAFCLINFDDKKKAIRDMMMAVFGKEVLGSSSMRGHRTSMSPQQEQGA